MDQQDAIARPYARALLHSLANDQEGALTCLNAAAAAIARPEVAAVITHPRLSKEVLASAFAGGPGLGCTAVTRLVALLIENGRLAYLPDIAEAFAALKDEHEGRARVDVTTALPLTDAEIDGFKTVLERRLGRTIVLTQHIDPTLLAGVIVQIEDMVLDGSVRGRLNALSQAMGPF